MIPITQTKVVVKNSNGEMIVRGNCYPAAVASLLELPISEVPNVETLYHIEGNYGNTVMHTFLNSLGYELCTDERFKCFHPELLSGARKDNEWIQKNSLELKDKYYLVSGDSPRGIMHITIWQNGKMVHDPHPTKEGLASLLYFESIEKINGN